MKVKELDLRFNLRKNHGISKAIYFEDMWSKEALTAKKRLEKLYGREWPNKNDHYVTFSPRNSNKRPNISWCLYIGFMQETELTAFLLAL